MRDLIVKITWAHIRDGQRGSDCDCPIALAVKDALLTNSVRVGADGIYINHLRWDVDKEDLKFIERFDNGKRVRPYSFRLPRVTRR